MATTFLEPGGDADFLVGTTNGFWSAFTGTPTIATDFVHGGHLKSIAFNNHSGGDAVRKDSILNDAGRRISLYLYIKTLPGATASIFKGSSSGFNDIFQIKITSGGVLQLFNTTIQIGSNGSALSTGQWYRISIAYTITSTTVNRFELFVNGISSISITNATLSFSGSDKLFIGNTNSNATLDIRTSDIYVDDSSSLTDMGDVWVTAKRPFSNGTTNGFTTQIGSGGSGYGTGHSPQINERPLSTTNGWSMVGVGSAVTEEYNIEGASTGDINIAGFTIVDYLGWVSAKSLSSETATIIVNGNNSNISLTSTITVFTQIAGSSSYPARTGSDIGIITTTALTTVSLYECGIVVAYINPIVYTMPASPSTFTFTPKVIGSPISRFLPVLPTSFSFTAQNSNFQKVIQIITLPAQFLVTGLIVGLKVSIQWLKQTKSSTPTYTTQTKNSAIWTKQSQSSSSWTKQSKS